MIKKAILVFPACFLLVIIGIYVFETFQSQNITSNISTRAKEYIKKQEEKNGSSQYSGIRLGKGTDKKDETFSVDNCFTLRIPFNVFNKRNEDKCSGYFAFENPKGSIVAFLREGKSLSFDNLEGVSFRRLNRDIYKEYRLKLKNGEFLIFENYNEPYLKNAYYFDKSKYLILTLNVPGGSSKSLDDNFKDILSSIKFN